MFQFQSLSLLSFVAGGVVGIFVLLSSRGALNTQCPLFLQNQVGTMEALSQIRHSQSRVSEQLSNLERTNCSLQSFESISTKPSTTPLSTKEVHPHTLIIYNTAAPNLGPDTPDGAHGKARDENILFFLKQGLIPDDPGFHFIIVINGLYPSRKSVFDEVSRLPNVEVIYRANYGYDCCAWKLTLTNALLAINEATGEDGLPVKTRYDSRSFKFFVLLNGSVRGPFLPAYLPINFPWPKLFTDKLNDDVRMSGSTLNCQVARRDRLVSLHVQTMIYSFRVEDLDFVTTQQTCVRGTSDDKYGVIMACEHGMTRHFDEAGYNYATMEPVWRNHNFRDKVATLAKCNTLNTGVGLEQGPGADPNFNPQRGHINGIGDNWPMWLSPTDLIFVKSNSFFPKSMIEAYTDWQYASRKSVKLNTL